MYESVFTYNVTRPYPYQWFTWLVIVGGVAATILFTFINLAANGYEPSVSSETSATDVESPSNLRWFQKKPWSWTSKVTSICQDQNTPVPSQFYTSNFGLLYSLIGARSAPLKWSRPSASIAYHDEPFTDCTVATLNIGLIDLNGTVSFPAKTDVICVTSEPKPARVELGVDFDIASLSLVDQSYGNTDPPLFLSHDKDRNASLWWGYEMLQLQLGPLLDSSRNKPLDGASCSLSREAPKNISNDVVQPSNFTPTASLMLDGNPYEPSAEEWSSKFGTDALDIISSNPPTNDESPASNSSDGEIMRMVYMNGVMNCLHSLLMTDLGQSTRLNVFASPRMTMDYFSKTLNTLNTMFRTYNPNSYRYNPEQFGNKYTFVASGLSPKDPIEFFQWIGTGRPEVRPATISTQYLCQTPKLKSSGSLFVSVVVADVVLLQVLWAVLNLVVTFCVGRRSPTEQYCAGCIKQLHAKQEGMEFEPISPSNRNYEQLPDPGSDARSVAISSRSVSFDEAPSVRRRLAQTTGISAQIP